MEALFLFKLFQRHVIILKLYVYLGAVQIPGEPVL